MRRILSREARAGRRRRACARQGARQADSAWFGARVSWHGRLKLHPMKEECMILRIDRWGAELPPPSDPDPAGAQAVQELMGGRFGEMSTLMNYTFQSLNFRGRQSARPFYDLIANIAAEEFGHIELVAATINSML